MDFITSVSSKRLGVVWNLLPCNGNFPNRTTILYGNKHCGVVTAHYNNTRLGPTEFESHNFRDVSIFKW